MTWLILLLLVVFEGVVAALIVKGIALLRGVWLRRSVGVVAMVAATVGSYFGMSACFNSHGPSFAFEEERQERVINEEGKPETGIFVSQHSWTWKHVFLNDYPLPTFRLFVLTIGLSLPALVIGLILIGLRGNPKNHCLPRARSWRSSRIFMVLGVSALLLVAMVYLNDRAICREIEACERRGDELAKSVAPPTCADADNAALVYAEAAQVLRAGPTRPSLDFDAPYRALGTPVWREYVLANQAAAKLMREGARRPRCRMKADWTHAPFIVESPEVAEFRECIRLLFEEGIQGLLDGNADLAYANASAFRRIAEHLASDPRELPQLIAGAVELMATKLLEYAMYVRAPSPEEIADLRRPEFDFRSLLHDVMVWSEAATCTGIGDMYFGRQLGDEDVRDWPGYLWMKESLLLKSRLLYARDDIYATPLHFRRYQQSANRFRPGWKEPIQIDPLPDAYAETAYTGLLTISNNYHAFSPYRAIAHNPGANTNRRLADLAVLLHERDLLKSVYGLSPDVALPLNERLIDPMNDKPLQIVVRDGGIVIYSVGRDCKDNGGEEMGRFNRGDVTFCLGEAFRVRRLEKQPETD